MCSKDSGVALIKEAGHKVVFKQIRDIFDLQESCLWSDT